MKLANNVVRINGYIGTKRTHVDIEVKMQQIKWFVGEKEVRRNIPDIDEYSAASLGFKNGLTIVTSYNFWNCVGNERMTVKLH